MTINHFFVGAGLYFVVASLTKPKVDLGGAFIGLLLASGAAAALSDGKAK